MSLNLLPTVLWSAIPFGDRDAFYDWNLQHFLTHVALAQKTRTSIITLDELRTDPFPHAQVHRNLAVALGAADNLDFASFDLTDRDSYLTFMLSHSQVHASLAKLANL